MDILSGLSAHYVYGVIGIFLLVNLFVGLWQGRHLKTLKSYALADRSMGTGTLAITIIATAIGSQYLTQLTRDPQEKGILAGVLNGSIMVLFLLLFTWFIFTKLLTFKDAYTLGEIMGKLYGKGAQVVTGVISSAISLALIAAQLLAIKHVCGQLGLHGTYVLLVIGVIIIVYTSLGGIRSVAATDVFQFVCLLAGFLFIVYRVFQLDDGGGKIIGSLQRLFAMTHEAHGTKYFTVLHHKRFSSVLLSSSMFVLVFLSPPIINRVLIARDVKQMRKAFYSFAAFYPILRLLLIIIGFGLLFKHGPSHIKENTSFAKVAEYFFEGNPWALVFLLLILLAVTMSTADSFLNSLVVVLMCDIVEPLQGTPKHKSHKLIPYLAIGCGSISICLAFALQKLLVTTIVFLSIRMLAVFVTPILLYVLRLKPNKKIFWISIGSFFVLGALLLYLAHINYIVFGDPIVWKNYFLRRKSNVIVPLTFCITFIISIIAHIIIHRGLVLVPHPKIEVNERNLKNQGEPTYTLRAILCNPLRWATEKIYYIGSFPVTLGTFISFAWMLPELSTPQPHPKNLAIFFWVRLIGLAICVSLMLHNRWGSRTKRYFPLFYFFALGYCIPFSYTLSYLYNPNNSINMISLTIALNLLMLLVDRSTFFYLWAAGAAKALLVAYLSPVHQAISFDAAWKISLAMIMTFVISFIFSHLKTSVAKNHLKTLRIWFAGYDHDMLNNLSATLGGVQTLRYQILPKFKKQVKNGKTTYAAELTQEDYDTLLAESVEETELGIKNIVEQSRAIGRLIRLGHFDQGEFEKISMLKASEKANAMILKSFIEDLNVRVDKSQDFEAVIHPVLFGNIVANLIKNVSKHAKASEVVLGCDAARREFYVKDNGKGISPHIEPYIFNLYFSTGSTGIGLPFVRKLVEMIGGTIRFTTSPQGTTFFIHFPPIPNKK